MRWSRVRSPPGSPFFSSGSATLWPFRAVIDATHDASGKKYHFPYEGHLWIFNAAGKVVKYQHVTHTAQHQRMAKGE